MNAFPRITFGLIVLNGEPFLRYNLRALYPFAHQIIVVEGASFAAKDIALPDGHSSDGTLQALIEFKAQEDPGNKVQIVTAEDKGYPNGFWPGEKDEQSRAYAERATGDYLWQVDVDEFYKTEDIEKIIFMLRHDPTITAVSFKMITFWGGFDYWVDGWYLWSGANEYHRLFRWGPQYTYVTHRPPTVKDARGFDLRKRKWLDSSATESYGINLYHYSLLFPKQVKEKAMYYAKGRWGAYSEGIIRWATDNFLEKLRYPFQAHNVHMHPSWVNRYRGTQPEQVCAMRSDLQRMNRSQFYLRDTSDLECLLSMRKYQFLKSLVRFSYPLYFYRGFPIRNLVNLILRIKFDVQGKRLYLSEDCIR